MSHVERTSYERRTPVPGEPVVEYASPLPPPVEPVVVAAPAAAVDPAVQRVHTERVVRFAPDSVITGAVGLALLLMGLVAVTRAGLDGPLSDPVVKVLGFTHTAALGIVEVVAGLLLLASAAARSRASEAFFGALVGVGGFVAAVQTSSFQESLAISTGLAWWFVVAGAVVVLAALLVPRVASRSATTVVR